MRLLTFALFLGGCFSNPIKESTPSGSPDSDGDGYTIDDGDCNDEDAAAHPGAEEVCDTLDNNCDGNVDEGAAAPGTWYSDSDADSYGDDNVSMTSCTQPSGYTQVGGDCNDADPAYHPGAAESCSDPNDYNCDGSVEYADDDGDGFPACQDCDDTNRYINPGAEEACDGSDNDCDGLTDETGATGSSTFYGDVDEDGYGNSSDTVTACDQPDGYVRNDDDCNDNAEGVNPNAIEVCDYVDNDCDGLTDGTDAVDSSTWYQDNDGDTYGRADISQIACDQPAGYVSRASDCDDGDANANPSATEYCDSIDNDCDGTVDESSAVDARTWYADSDSDTYGNPYSTSVACNQPSGYVANDDDCNDSTASASPVALERCDAIDNDCDGLADEDDAIDADTWYADDDNDTYGDPGASRNSCNQPSGYVANDDDCNDNVDTVNPAAIEVCDDLDNDCDGSVDGTDAVGAPTWYRDGDNDGYGSSSTVACDQPAGYVTVAGDCADADAAVNPAAIEVCDGLDNDCDGITDGADAVDGSVWYRDADSDGYGDATMSTANCSQPSGYVADSTDCDDTNDVVNPGHDELCDDIDNDCDSMVDEDAVDMTYLYEDADGDGFGNPGSLDLRCDGSDNELDCDDADASEPNVVDQASTASYEDGTLNAPWQTLEIALDAADADSCIVVYPGLYTETVDFGGRGLVITSVGGADVTIIDGDGGGPVVTFDGGEGADAELSGFTLTNGSGYETTSSVTEDCGSTDDCNVTYTTWCGGGLYIDGATPTLEDLVLSDNLLETPTDDSSGLDRAYYYSYGGGLCVRNADITLTGVDVIGNYAEDGGGIYVESTGSLTMSEGWIMSNTADNGAGIEVDGGSLSLSNVAIVWNEATDEGGGILAIDATVGMINLTIGNNNATTGGGFYASGSTLATVLNTIIYGSDTGVGVLVDSLASYTTTYSNVYGNTDGNFSGVTDPTGSSGNISADPLFTSVTDDGNTDNDDWSLSSSSPSRNAGHPSSSYYDVTDGTRNDQGAFGGPNGNW